jgi:hypothetical protein
MKLACATPECLQQPACCRNADGELIEKPVDNQSQTDGMTSSVAPTQQPWPHGTNKQLPGTD